MTVVSLVFFFFASSLDVVRSNFIHVVSAMLTQSVMGFFSLLRFQFCMHFMYGILIKSSGFFLLNRSTDNRHYMKLRFSLMLNLEIGC